MERKLNVPYSKQKWSSQPELITNMGLVDTERELYLLATLSGINFDFDVFKILVDLLRLNVNPNSLLDVLRKIANQSSSFSNDIANQTASSLPKDNMANQNTSLSKDVPGQSSSLLPKSRSNLNSSSSSVPKKVIKKRPMSEILYSRDSESSSSIGSSLSGAGSFLGGAGSSLGGVGSSLSGIDTFSTMSSYSSFLSDLKDKKESRQPRSVSDM